MSPRRFGHTSERVAVFFVTHLSRPLSGAELARALAPLGRPLAQRARENWLALRRRHPGLAVISVRELLAGAEAELRDRLRERFRSLGWLAPYSRAAARAAAAPAYAGPYPPRLPAPDARWLFAQMVDIQSTAAAVLREGLAVSPSHVVLSARRRGFMTITATDTDKSEVCLYGHTPLVAQRGSGLVYYGDRAHPPSSEARSHWHLHQALARWDPAGAACLLHFHHAGLRDAARVGADLRLGAWRLPCISPRAYGSRGQGLALAAAMRRARSRAVTVAAHGTWFAGASQAAALKLARRLTRLFSLTSSSAQC